MAILDLLDSSNPSHDVLAGMIIDLGLLPVDLCTPTLMQKINDELQSKIDSEYISDERVKDMYDFMKYFAHRRRCDAIYRRQSELLSPRYLELFDNK